MRSGQISKFWMTRYLSPEREPHQHDTLFHCTSNHPVGDRNSMAFNGSDGTDCWVHLDSPFGFFCFVLFHFWFRDHHRARLNIPLVPLAPLPHPPKPGRPKPHSDRHVCENYAHARKATAINRSRHPSLFQATTRGPNPGCLGVPRSCVVFISSPHFPPFCGPIIAPLFL
ncbi:hypothetical protein VTI74DRAFT_8422 [Chaetomium olivicolor]